MRLNVHILQTFDSEFIDTLTNRLSPKVALSHGPTIPSPAEYHILVAGRFEKHDLTASPALQTVIIPWSGLPQAARLLLLEFPHLAVHNLHHNATPTAEMAITLMLTAAKGIIPIDRALRNNDWTPRYDSSRSGISGDRTALILGYGAIGRKIAAICKGLGMKVVAIRRQDQLTGDNSAEVQTISKLHSLLPRADVCFISVPFTPETSGLIGGKELSLLPDGAILVNIARGPIVHELALYEELERGRIRAGLDVWYHYPEEKNDRPKTPPSDYPFHELDNVVMTPHLAGHSRDTENLRAESLAELLNLAAEGKPLPNAVDPKRGY